MKTMTMNFSLPEGGDITCTWPEHIESESVELFERVMAIQITQLRRYTAGKFNKRDYAAAEYASWIAQPTQGETT